MKNYGGTKNKKTKGVDEMREIGGGIRRLGLLGGIRERKTSEKIKGIAVEILKESDLSEIFEATEMEGNYAAAGAALKSIVAERMADYAIKAMKEAKRRRMPLGAAAIIIAAHR
jgi:hypothetical protein